jgi:hypothetical protein
VRALRERLAGAARIEAYPLDVEDACKQYAEAGYDVSAPLREHLERYGELTVTWCFRAGETYLKAAVEEALDNPDRNVRNYGGRLGQPVVRWVSRFQPRRLSSWRRTATSSSAGMQECSGWPTGSRRQSWLLSPTTGTRPSSDLDRS